MIGKVTFTMENSNEWLGELNDNKAIMSDPSLGDKIEGTDRNLRIKEELWLLGLNRWQGMAKSLLVMNLGESCRHRFQNGKISPRIRIPRKIWTGN